ncbi:helix-turn-helix domain-containing protein [Caballeronia sp. BR00000012568055]|uniref:helix-turn-helix domain-containing protein n=1 Tax=Caballeronia sp. BR00000012568055 TaxID=2918761 RepID=UPI0023F7203C|nr:helix-turn-helix domain-containing protein [Caballeronia sp. BR00000012568055]
MEIEIRGAGDIGAAVRAARKSQKLRQDDAAGAIGVSESFLGKVESGAESVQWGKLFQVLEGLGVHVIVDVPDGVGERYASEKMGQYGRAARAEKRRRDKEQQGES